MTIDRTKKYFFHNIYGGEQELLDSLPSDVIAQPVGWSEEVEVERNDLLKGLTDDSEEDGHFVMCSTYPTVFYWRPSYTRTITTTDEDGENFTYQETSNSAWSSVSFQDFYDTDNAYTWSDVTNIIDANMATDALG